MRVPLGCGRDGRGGRVLENRFPVPDANMPVLVARDEVVAALVHVEPKALVRMQRGPLELRDQRRVARREAVETERLGHAVQVTCVVHEKVRCAPRRDHKQVAVHRVPCELHDAVALGEAPAAEAYALGGYRMLGAVARRRSGFGVAPLGGAREPVGVRDVEADRPGVCPDREDLQRVPAVLFVVGAWCTSWGECRDEPALAVRVVRREIERHVPVDAGRGQGVYDDGVRKAAE